MKDQRARQILHSLVNGADPFTGEDLAPGTVLQHADVMRAMLTGCSALEERTTRAGRQAQKPKNIGKAWTAEEQEQLLQAFHGGESLEEVAAKHGRTLRAIESRLEILGLLTREQRTTENRFGAGGQHDEARRTGARKSQAGSKKATG
jgi:DNA-binding NarL/FixJ family response regulator